VISKEFLKRKRKRWSHK